MPIGCTSFVPMIAHELMKHRPASVLDLGIGMGFYGAVVRQWLDLGVRPWRTCLVGVEGFEAYRNPCWELYDGVVAARIEDYLAMAGGVWDAILLLDVLEHFKRTAGESVLSAARQRLSANGRLFVGTPAVWMEQGAFYGNELERHRSLWTADELRAVGFTVLWDGSPDTAGNEMLLSVA